MGGVYVCPYDNKTSFKKNGGTITGINSINGNVVKDFSSGNIVNNKGSAVYIEAYSSDTYNSDTKILEKRKEITAGPGDNLSFTFSNDNSTFSGAWDY